MTNRLCYFSLFLLIALPTAQECETPSDDDDDTPVTGTPVPFQDCSDLSGEFWAYDFSVMPPGMQLVPATCRLEGGYAYLYVADDQWGTYVDEADVEAVLTRFERETPEGSINPETGLYQNDVTVFGDPPDALDQDPKIYLLFLDMVDYVSDDGDVFSFDGYFGSLDQYPDEDIQAQTFGRYHSNEVEIIFLNSRIRPIDDDETLSVIAHEFQHMIAWNYDESEDVWLSESLAEVAMIVNGYYTDEYWVEYYAEWPGYPLVYDGAVNYGACMLWGMYLYEQIGSDFMLHLEEEQRDGISGLDRALLTYGSSDSFMNLFTDWMVANTVNDPDSPRYGYAFASLPDFTRMEVLNKSGDVYEGLLYPFGVDYLDVVLLSSSSATLRIDTDAPEYTLAQLVRWQAGVMADVEYVVIDTSGSATSLELTKDTPDTTWTLAISNTDETEVGEGTTMGYGVSLAP